MNGNIYIQLPCDQPNISDDICSKIKVGIAKNVKPYFGADIQVYFFKTAQVNSVAVYIMDNPKYPGHENDIKEHVRHILVNYIPSLSSAVIDVKINYGKFNPTFNPMHNHNVADSPKATTTEKMPSAASSKGKSSDSDEFDYEKLSMNYSAQEPRYSFDQVILPEKTLEQIEQAIGILEVEKKVFDEWGLRSIIPTASSALSFYGPPGTGKSMAAEAIAHKLGKKILSATYADIESKYHGEGPKMVKAIFLAAERDNAVLFLDESDSLLSKRLTNVSDGSAQAINSMRSQLLISLERFEGIVIFATNLVVNYDKAFLSRLINIEFTMPTAKEREKIWWRHLKTDTVRVPLSDDVDIRALADQYEFCGREIKSAVKSACIATALEKRDAVTQNDFIKACETTKEEAIKVSSANDHTISQKAPVSDSQKSALIEAVQKKIDAAETVKLE